MTKIDVIKQFSPALTALVFLGAIVAICWRCREGSSRILRWFIAGAVASAVLELAMIGVALGASRPDVAIGASVGATKHSSAPLGRFKTKEHAHQHGNARQRA